MLCASIIDVLVCVNKRLIKTCDITVYPGGAYESADFIFVSFQVFIEPKGGHLSAKDKWKEDLLKAMKEKRIVVKDLDNYIITGVPFYNYDNENEFKKELNETLRTII